MVKRRCYPRLYKWNIIINDYKYELVNFVEKNHVWIFFLNVSETF